LPLGSLLSYTTSPLLRLIQLWQNFQKPLYPWNAWVIWTPQETDSVERQNIPMPEILGAVKYEQVSFRFTNSGSQLININLDFPAGCLSGLSVLAVLAKALDLLPPL